MIVEIGLIVGTYVFTRMVEVLCRPKEQRNLFLALCALGTLILTTLCVIDLVLRALSGNIPSL